MEVVRFTQRDLRSEDAILRRRALGALVRETEGKDPSSSLLRACVARLADRERSVRRFSADSLAHWLADGSTKTRRNLRRRLRDALKYRNSQAAWSAAHILARVDGPRPGLAEPLLRGFNLEDEDARWEAAQTLTKLAQTHLPLAGRLKTLSRRGSPLERRMALCCLRDLPRSVHNRPEAFLSALDDPDPIVRSAAVTSLGRMGPRTPHVLDGLLAKLKADPSILIRRVAAVALGQIAAGRRDVRSSLEETMEADDPDLRRAARHALARLSPVPERRRRSALRSRRSEDERRGRKRK